MGEKLFRHEVRVSNSSSNIPLDFPTTIVVLYYKPSRLTLREICRFSLAPAVHSVSTGHGQYLIFLIFFWDAVGRKLAW